MQKITRICPQEQIEEECNCIVGKPNAMIQKRDSAKRNQQQKSVWRFCIRLSQPLNDCSIIVENVIIWGHPRQVSVEE